MPQVLNIRRSTTGTREHLHLKTTLYVADTQTFWYLHNLAAGLKIMYKEGKLTQIRQVSFIFEA